MLNMLEMYKNSLVLSRDEIEKNKHIAQAEFKNVIEKFKNVRGANLIKRILELNLSGLTEEECSIASNLIRAFLIPNKAVFNNEFTTKNNFSRAIFCLTLIKKLQELYIAVLDENKDESNSIDWIPSWSKKFAGKIKEEIIFQNKKANYFGTKAYTITFLTFLLSYFIFMKEKDSDYKLLKNTAPLLLLMILLTFLNAKFNHKVDLYFKKKSDAREFGESYDLIYKMITDIQEKFPSNAINCDADLDTSKLLFDRSHAF